MPVTTALAAFFKTFKQIGFGLSAFLLGKVLEILFIYDIIKQVIGVGDSFLIDKMVNS